MGAGSRGHEIKSITPSKANTIQHNIENLTLASGGKRMKLGKWDGGGGKSKMREWRK